jgi:hypothetical protein
MRKTVTWAFLLVLAGSAPAVAANQPCAISHTAVVNVDRTVEVPCYNSVSAGAPPGAIPCANCPGAVLQFGSMTGFVCIEHFSQPEITTVTTNLSGHVVKGVCVPDPGSQPIVSAAHTALPLRAAAPAVSQHAARPATPQFHVPAFHPPAPAAAAPHPQKPEVRSYI